MENIILLVHLLAAISIIVLILLQQGKGAEMGASFGSGASQTLFGSAGTGNFFSRMTAVFALVFFVTSFSLAVIAKQQTQLSDDGLIPSMEEVDLPVVVEDVEEELPVIDDAVDSVNIDSAVEDATKKMKSAVEDAKEMLQEMPSDSDLDNVGDVKKAIDQ